jgi:hypothetical protein
MITALKEVSETAGQTTVLKRMPMPPFIGGI